MPLSDFSKLAYCPIDLPLIDIDEVLIRHLVEYYDTGHHDGLWKCLPLIGRVNTQREFEDASAFERAWELRYQQHGVVQYNMNVYSKLKPLFDHLEKLPLKITHAQILNQTADVGKHYDMKHDETGKLYYDDYPDANVGMEPAGYKVLLNNFKSDSFYVSEGFGRANHYIRMPDDTNTFVINEKRFPHGATKPDKPKYIVSIFGLIDAAQHFKLIQDSIVKYQDYAITFS